AALPGARLKARGKKIFSATPLVRLWVTDLGGDLRPLAAIPEENTLTSLDLCYNRIGLDALKRLTTFTRLRGLRTLGLMFNALDDQCAAFLCEHPFFQQLSLLRCGANPIREAGREQLRSHFGGRVSFLCERDPDHLYPFQDDRFTAGFGNDDTQLLVRGWEH